MRKAILALVVGMSIATTPIALAQSASGPSGSLEAFYQFSQKEWFIGATKKVGELTNVGKLLGLSSVSLDVDAFIGANAKRNTGAVTVGKRFKVADQVDFHLGFGPSFATGENPFADFWKKFGAQAGFTYKF